LDYKKSGCLLNQRLAFLQLDSLTPPTLLFIASLGGEESQKI
jgi:hypothetical protein